MNREEIDHRLKLMKRKKNTVIVDGIVHYPITVTNNSIMCLCSSYSNDKSLCKHVKYYMHQCGFDFALLDHWIKMKNHIVSELKKGKIDNDKLWKIVQREIIDTECVMCMIPIKNRSYCICDTCQNIACAKCYSKWDRKNKGCMFCRN